MWKEQKQHNFGKLCDDVHRAYNQNAGNKNILLVEGYDGLQKVQTSVSKENQTNGIACY